MVNREKMWEILRRDYDIHSMDQLERALYGNKGIDIAIFTTERKNYDAERISGGNQYEADGRAG